MSQENESDDKIYEPTQRKLDEARKKGDIPRSQDVNVAASYLGLILAVSAAGAFSVDQFGTAMSRLISDAEALSLHIFADGNPAPMSGAFIYAVFIATLPILVLPGMITLGALFAQRAIVFAPSKLEPKLNRISPIQNAKNKYGRSGLFEFFKSFLKLVVYAVILAIFLSLNLDKMTQAMFGSVGSAALMLGEILVEFMLLSLVVAAAIAAIDFMFQRAEHTSKNRMSHKELMDEQKQAEGDPHMKSKRRQKAQELASSRMMDAVPNADVVVVNPEHYAVALAWSRLPGSAPECVAKGVDEMALAIRRKAEEADVPIQHDPPTARALYATVAIGQEIEPSLYEAVAAAIRFSETMRTKARERGLNKGLSSR